MAAIRTRTAVGEAIAGTGCDLETTRAEDSESATVGSPSLLQRSASMDAMERDFPTRDGKDNENHYKWGQFH